MSADSSGGGGNVEGFRVGGLLVGETAYVSGGALGRELGRMLRLATGFRSVLRPMCFPIPTPPYKLSATHPRKAQP